MDNVNNFFSTTNLYLVIKRSCVIFILFQDSAWEQNLSPAHIPGYLSQELKLKKKVFVGMVHPSVNIYSLIGLHQKTWAKGGNMGCLDAALFTFFHCRYLLFSRFLM